MSGDVISDAHTHAHLAGDARDLPADLSEADPEPMLTADRARHVAIGVAESVLLRLRAMPATAEMPKVAEALEAVERMVYGDK